MTLKITLKPGEGFMIGAAHVEIVSKTNCTVLIEGDEPVLRADYAIRPKQVVDTSTRLRHVLQKMYQHGDVAAFHDEYFTLTQQLLAEKPEVVAWITQTNKHLIAGDLYEAIKTAKRAAETEPLPADEDAALLKAV